MSEASLDRPILSLEHYIYVRTPSFAAGDAGWRRAAGRRDLGEELEKALTWYASALPGNLPAEGRLLKERGRSYCRERLLVAILSYDYWTRSFVRDTNAGPGDRRRLGEIAQGVTVGRGDHGLAGSE